MVVSVLVVGRRHLDRPGVALAVGVPPPSLAILGRVPEPVVDLVAQLAGVGEQFAGPPVAGLALDGPLEFREHLVESVEGPVPETLDALAAPLSGLARPLADLPLAAEEPDGALEPFEGPDLGLEATDQQRDRDLVGHPEELAGGGRAQRRSLTRLRSIQLEFLPERLQGVHEVADGIGGVVVSVCHGERYGRPAEKSAGSGGRPPSPNPYALERTRPRTGVRIENSFIPVRGVGERTERKLWEAGVTHWDEFSGDVVGPTIGDRIDDYIREGRARLADDDLGFFAEELPASSRWRLYENASRSACFLDIETTGLDADYHDVTTVTLHRGGETTTLVAGRDLTASRLQAELDRSALLVTFNGRRFDVPFLETCYDVDASVPHVDLLYPCRMLELTGGLKQVERDLGIGRDLPDLSGRDAVRLWHEYERGNEESLETLIEYNRADTVNLETVMERVADRLHRQVFESVRAD